MGWSCRADAMRTFERISDECIRQTKGQNTYSANGISYFFEASNKEHDDGAITGSIHGTVGRNAQGQELVRVCGHFRIEGNGHISKGPKHFRDLDKGV